MKVKALILVIISAIITLSFAFIDKKVSSSKNESIEVSSSRGKNEPSGGIIMEDKM